MGIDLKAVLIDAVRGSPQPTNMFGRSLSARTVTRCTSTLRSLAATARSQVTETFVLDVTPDHSGLMRLDAIITDMWHEGWDPACGDARLFTRDFGLLLADALLGIAGAQSVFRSTTILDHTSVWFSASRTEYFPFHKAHKAAHERDGESIAQMFRSAATPATVDGRPPSSRECGPSGHWK